MSMKVRGAIFFAVSVLMSMLCTMAVVAEESSNMGWFDPAIAEDLLVLSKAEDKTNDYGLSFISNEEITSNWRGDGFQYTISIDEEEGKLEAVFLKRMPKKDTSERLVVFRRRYTEPIENIMTTTIEGRPQRLVLSDEEIVVLSEEWLQDPTYENFMRILELVKAKQDGA